jgi:hypothetical protein
MGYVNVTDICKFISPFDAIATAGTWTPSIASSVIKNDRTAADASFSLFIPIALPGSNLGKQGAYLVSVDVWYIIATAACDDFTTAALVKMSLPVDGSAPTGSNPSATLDADHDTAAERKAADEHKMTFTLDTPEFIEDDEAWYVYLVVDAAATSVFSLVGAQANFTLRL